MENEASRDSMLDMMLARYEQTDYPPKFESSYVMLECLSERAGIDTFLVQDRSGALFIAKCYDHSLWSVTDRDNILNSLDHEGIPRHEATFTNEKMTVSLREYIEGTSLDLYAREHELDEQEIVRICLGLCDILDYLHHREEPVIHRDIKPQNMIIKPDGKVALIDFDIARIYHSGNDTDTVFFGTVAYAPPEQYGFSQTDARTDIYSLGVLLRYLLTGDTRENKNVRVYRPLSKIIKKCTGFDPKERFGDIRQVKKALLLANPRSQGIRFMKISCLVLALFTLVFYGGFRAYKVITYDPFNSDAIPAVLNDDERIADGIRYMKEKYNTSLFDHPDDLADVKLLRETLMECYGLTEDYVYGLNPEDMPGEGDGYFFPWHLEDNQYLDRDYVVYSAVKVHDPSIVADWSSLKDDTGEYPGIRVADAFADKTGIKTGANQPREITSGELALIFANTDRVFEEAEKEE